MGKQRAGLMLIALLLLLILGWWRLSMVETTPAVSTQASATSTPTTSSTYEAGSLIVVHHAKVQGADVYSGKLQNATACSQISSGISASGQNPAHIIVLLTVSNPSGGCTGTFATSTQDFSVSYQSTDAKAPVLNGVTINSAAVPYTLTEDN